MSLRELIEREPDTATLNRWLAKVPYATYMGMSAEVSGKEVLFCLHPRPDLVGNATLPAMHGGVVGAFMEQAASFHLISKMIDPALPKVINFSLDYIRPTRMADTFASCSLTRQGKQIANVCITAWQEQRDHPCATARGHFLIPESI